MKKFFQKLKPAAATLVGGLLQSVPGGNAVTKIGPAIAKMMNGTYKDIPLSERPKWMQILIELIGVGVVIYAFHEKWITVDQVLKYLHLI